MQQMQASRPAQKPASRMALDAVIRGKVEKPLRVLVYGVEGVGKSTFASDAPSPIFIGAEDGTAQLDTVRFPEPENWSDVFDALDVLSGGHHSYQTLVIDTLDWLEPLCWAAVCKAKRVESIEDLGYGKGYVVALEEWRRLLAALDRLRVTRGMGIILLAHSQIRSFKNPAGDDYDRFELKLHAKSGGLIKEWADAVLFATHETYTSKVDGRTKGVSTGARVIHTSRVAAYDAKNRHDLPETLPLSWESFAEAVRAHRPADPGKITERIEAMLAQADERVVPRVRTAMVKASGDPAELARIADKLAAMVSIATH